MGLWFRRAREAKTAPPHDAPGSSCTLCGADREAVRKLVAGRRGAVCDACAFAVIAVLDAEDDRKGSSSLAMIVLTRLEIEDEKAPFARTTALAQAAMELARHDLAVVRRAARALLRCENAAAALQALARIPVEERTLQDRIAVSHAHAVLHAFDEALRTLPPPSEAKTAPDRLELVLSQADCSLLASPPPAGDALFAIERKLQEAELLDSTPRNSVVDEGGVTSGPPWRDRIDLCIAHLDFLRGRIPPAESRVRKLVALPKPPAHAARALLLLGDIVLAKGDLEDARGRWTAALDAAHAEGRNAEAARSRLGGVSHGYR